MSEPVRPLTRSFAVAVLSSGWLAAAGVEPSHVAAPRPEVSLSRTAGVLREHATIPSRAVVKVARTGPTDAPLTVRLHTNPNRGWAESGVDIETVPETVTIPAGASSVDIEIKVINDDAVEGDEPFDLFVAFSNDYAINLDTVQTSVTIRDNDFWRWRPVAGKQLARADVSQKLPLPGLDGWFGNPASMSLAGSVTATNDSVKADLAAAFFDGGLISDTRVTSEASFEATFAFDPVSGKISRSHGTSGASSSGMLSAELARSIVIDNTGPRRHTAHVTVALVAAVKGHITVSGDGEHVVGRKGGPPLKPLSVSVTKTDPVGDSLSRSTKLILSLERVENDGPKDMGPVEAERP